jgi:hypothetical protein
MEKELADVQKARDELLAKRNEIDQKLLASNDAITLRRPTLLRCKASSPQPSRGPGSPEKPPEPALGAAPANISKTKSSKS